MPDIYIDRDVLAAFHKDAVASQAQLTLEHIAANPPPLPAPPPPPLPVEAPPAPPPIPVMPPPPAAPAPTPIDAGGGAQPASVPAPASPADVGGPPSLSDFLSRAGLDPLSANGLPATPSIGANTSGQPSDASSGPPSLQAFMRQAGLGGAADAIGNAASAVGSTVQNAFGGGAATDSSAPPPLQDYLQQAGVLDPGTRSTTPTPSDSLTNPLASTSTADTHVSQFGMGLSPEDAYAACGVAAALGFAKRTGRMPTADEAMQLARAGDWDNQVGMHGALSEQHLLQGLGVATRLETNDPEVLKTGQATPLNWDHVTKDAINSNPIALSTPGHWYFIDSAQQGPDGVTLYHVGSQGTDLRGGSAWMTRAQIEGMAQSHGNVTAALYADNPTSPHPSVADEPATKVQTTAGLSGGGALAGRVGDAGIRILSGAADAASWLGTAGQQALQAVLVTEGGLNRARGDQGRSAGPLQFFEGGQLANIARDLGVSLEQAKTWVEDNPIKAVQWAIGTPDEPGYLGRVIADGIQRGLSGAELATYAQRHGQVSVSPERAGANYDAMFGSGQSVVTTTSSTNPTDYGALADRAGQLSDQGAALTAGLTPPQQADPRAAINADTDRRAAALRQAIDSTAAQSGAPTQPTASTSDSSAIGAGLPPTPPTGGGPDDNRNALQKWGQQLTDSIIGMISHLAGPQPLAASQQRTPSDTLTNLPLQNTPLDMREAPPPQPDSVQRVLGDAANAIGGSVGDLAAKVQSPGTGNPLVDVAGTGASALGTTVSHALSPFGPSSEEFPSGGPLAGPVVGAERGRAALDQLYATDPKYRGLVDELAALESAPGPSTATAATLSPEDAAKSARIRELRRQVGSYATANSIDLAALAQRNPALPAREGAASALQGAVAVPLAAEGMPLIARTIAEVLQPGTNIGEVLSAARNLVSGRAFETVAPALERAFADQGIRMGATAEERATQVSQLGNDARGLLQTVHNFLADQSGELRVGRPPAEDVASSTRRFYHGTGSDFARPDAAKFDPNGLFGPGYYMTDSPEVAGGRVAQGGELSMGRGDRQVGPHDTGAVISPGYAQTALTTIERPQLDAAFNQTADALAEQPGGQYIAGTLLNDLRGRRQNTFSTEQVAAIIDNADRNPRLTSILDQLRSQLGIGAGPNVRAVDVPKSLNLLNADIPITAEQAHAIADQLPEASRQTFINRVLPAENTNRMLAINQRGRGPATGEEAYRALDDLVPFDAEGQQPANRILARAGFDGIQYAGGKRVPMTDAAGQAIEHTAVNIFPQSIDKLRNAVSGTQGGAIGVRPAIDLAGATAGGGATYASTDENDPNRLLKTAGGALAGGLVAHGASSAIAARGAPPSTRTAQAIAANMPTSPQALLPGMPAGGIHPRIQQLLGGHPEYARIAQDGLDDLQASSADPAAVARYFAGVERSAGLPSGVDANAWFRSLRNGAMAGSVQTVGHVSLNIPLQVLWHVVSDPIAAVIRNQPEQIPAGIAGLWKGAAMAGQDALETLRYGITSADAGAGGTAREIFDPISGAMRSSTDASRSALPPNIALRTDNRAVQLGANALQGLVGTHGAAQVYIQRLGFYKRANELAATQAKSEGLSGKLFSVRVDDIMSHLTDPQWASIATEAQNFGDRMALRGAQGLVGTKLRGIAGAGIGGNLLIPFESIAYKVFTTGIEATPGIGAAGLVADLANARRGVGPYAAGATDVTRGAVTPAAERAANQILGLGIFAGGLGLAAAGTIVGSGPSNPQERATALDAGQQFDGVKIGNMFIPGHMLGQSWYPLALAANVYEAQKYAKQGATPEEMMGDAVQRTGTFLANMTFARQFADVMAALKDPTGKQLERLVAQEVTSVVPQAGVMRDIGNVTDPSTRQPDTSGNFLGDVGARVEAQLPILRNMQPPRINATTGQETPNRAGPIASAVHPPLPTDPVAAEALRLQIAGEPTGITQPKASYQGGTQSPEQLTAVQRAAGQAVQLYATHLLNDPLYAQLNDAQKADALRSALSLANKVTNVRLGNTVSRGPGETALLQWAQTPHYVRVSGTPQEIAEQNLRIEEARAKLSAYKTQYGTRGATRLRADDPAAYSLAMHSQPINSVQKKRLQDAIDKATGGALYKAAQKASSGGLVGVGASLLDVP